MNKSAPDALPKVSCEYVNMIGDGGCGHATGLIFRTTEPKRRQPEGRRIMPCGAEIQGPSSMRERKEGHREAEEKAICHRRA